MNTKAHKITVSGIPVEVVRKDIKNLHLAVYPPKGHVRIAVPRRIDDEAVRLAVVSKLGWIRDHQRSFLGQDRQSLRDFVDGETHYIWGKRYRLRVIAEPKKPAVQTRGKTILQLFVAAGANRAKREDVLMRWYREQIKAEVPQLIAKWEARMGVKVQDWGIKRMRTKWGSCNAAAGRIWLNIELAKKPVECLEYIVVHEMTHLLERHHNERFIAHMDQFLPHWRNLRDELNRLPLAHENWELRFVA